MGNNESLPPPPPPGGHPTPPPPPPPTAQPPAAPTTPVAPPAAPSAPAYGSVPPPPAQPPAPPTGDGGAPKNRRNLMIAGAIAAVIALVVVIVLVAGGKDSSTPTLGDDSTPTTVESVSTTEPATTTSAAPSTSAAPQTTSEPTFVITVPPSDAPSGTTTPGADTTAPAGVQVVTDGTNSFKVTLPKQFNTQVKPLTSNGITFAHVSGSKDLDKYLNTDDVFGISILGATTDKVATPEDFLKLIKPADGSCSATASETITVSNFGRTVVDRYDGCGTGGKFSKVIMAAEVKGQNAVVLAFCQGPSPSDGDLFTFAKAVFETVTPL